jgi:hypothetical protein
MLNRRDFIKFLGATGAVILSPLRRLEWFKPLEVVQAEEPVGELYAGFVLLPEGAPAPEFVKYPEVMVPIICGAGQNSSQHASMASTENFSTIVELANRIQFPIFKPAPLPNNLKPTAIKLIKHKISNEIYLTEYILESDAAEESVMAIMSAYTKFPAPFPLWSSEPVEPNETATVPEKVDFLPSPGIMVSSKGGNIFNWIGNNIFYSLIVEPALSREDAEILATSLSVVN